MCPVSGHALFILRTLYKSHIPSKQVAPYRHRTVAVADPVMWVAAKFVWTPLVLTQLKMIEVLSRNEIGNFADPDT